MVTSGLVLCLDAANTKSYPGSGTTWYDLSGEGNDGTLTNGPTFNPSGWIEFDGVDDYISISNPLSMQSNLDQEWTVMAWVNLTEKTEQILVYGMNRHLYVVAWQGNNSILYLNGGANDYYKYGGDLISPGRWSFVTFRFRNSDGLRTIYKNLTDVTTSGPNKTSTPYGISSTLQLGKLMQGKLGGMLMYSRVLSDIELQQNYYQAPIVTDGLVFAVDAGNLVSYESGSTTTYSLTGSMTGSLQNSTGYLPNSGGTWDFDGTDDYITQGPSSELDTNIFSVEAFARLDTFDNNHRTIMARNASVYSHTNGWWFGTLRNGLGSGHNDLRFFMWGDSSYITFSSMGVDDGNYHHIIITCDGTTGYFYIDGELKYSANKPSGNLYNSSAAMTTGRSPSGDYWAGDIPLTRFYNTALTAAEVAQNYNATKSKFL